jgi:membrane protein DedA with SNARE-associated domain
MSDPTRHPELIGTLRALGRPMGHTFADLLSSYGYVIVALFMIAEGCGIPFPAETMLVTAAAVASRGTLSIWGVAVAGVIGGIIGGSAGYVIGAQGGLRLLRRYGKKVHIDESRLTRSRRFFERRGLWAVFICRFIGWVRIIVPMLAGISHMPFGRFSAANAAGSVASAAAYATLGYLFGRDLPALEHHLTEATIVGVVLVVLWLVYTRLRGGRTAEAR